MNLASPDSKVYEFGCRVLKEDILRMDNFDIDYFVLHPGSHLGTGVADSVQRVSDDSGHGREIETIRSLSGL